MLSRHARYHSKILGLLIAAVACVIHAPPSSGQYMYLDANGDGIHTAADLVNASGFTVVDIWIDSDSNRDGTPGDCPSEPGALLTINSYVFNLRAIGGTISWGAYVNHFPAASIQFSQGSNATEYWNGFGSPVIQPPGLYRLGTLTLSVASGSPAITIIPRAPSTSDETSFGSGCDGPQFDNTMRLGEDWFDTDGLSFGGGASSEPVLAPLQDMETPVGENASQQLSATDSDGQPLTFSMVSGPGYAHVLTGNPGTGTASGSIHTAPFVADIGQAPVVVSVTDGAASSEGAFTSTVVASPNHSPSSRLPSSVTAVVGMTRRIPLGGTDADGQLAHWRLVSGPSFARVLDLQRRPGGVAGILELTPSPCADAGSSVVALGLSDGVSETVLTLQVELLPAPSAPGTINRAPHPHGPVAVATGDFNGDGRADVATADGAGNSVTVFRTLASGGLQNLGEIPVGVDPRSIVAGDFDEDGVLDLAATISTGIAVLIGDGQGFFQSLPAQPAGNTPIALRSAHVNRDDHLDLLVANSGTNSISVLLGNGDGTFALGSEAPVGAAPADFAVGDLDLDGRSDLAVIAAGEVRILRGFGDGTFAGGGTVSVGGTPFAIVLEDWDSDGLLDLATVGGSSLRVFLARTGGSYEQTASISGAFFEGPIGAKDLDLDGNPDIVANNGSLSGGFRVYRGAGNGTFPTQDPIGVPHADAVAFDDADRDGYPDVFLPSTGLIEMIVRINPYAGRMARARAFHKNEKAIALSGAGGSVCLYLEPLGGSYSNSEVVFTSLKLGSTGTGSVSEIQPITNKTTVEGDVDRNGVSELSICFARGDMSRLFDQLQGKQTVIASLQGSLRDGRSFCTDISLEIKGGSGGSLAASVSPNPLNPRATLRFSTTRAGSVKVRMYDLQGRVVRTLLERPTLPAGSHEVEIDGRSQNGQTLASGIYFYEVEATEGRVRGRLTILK